MQDNSTRSGLLWEVERILTEQKELEKQGKGKMCEILLMENVPQIHSEQDLPHFIKWINRLEELGYQSYWEDCIATEIGYPEPIPQSRNRCFMVSIYGDYVYNFPKPKTLKLRLKDLLEKNVDEKYYLSKKQIKDIQGWNAYQKPLETMEQTDKSGISPTLTTRSGAYAAGMVLVKEDIAIGAAMRGRNGKQQLELNNKEISNALTTVQKDSLVLLIDDTIPRVLGGIGEKDSNGGTQWKQQNRIYDNNVAISLATGFAPWYQTEEESEEKITIPLKRGYDCEVKQEQDDTNQIDVIGNYSKSNYVQTSIVGKNGVAPTVTENHGQVTAILDYVDLKYRIRKLTPRECFRLQAVKDNDIDKIMKHQSDASEYHLAGDSICCSVLQAIFKELM